MNNKLRTKTERNPITFERPRSKLVKGFTLVELLVVIAIISLLTSVVLASLGVARQKGRDTERLSDIRQLRTALQLYLTDNQTFPSSLSALAPTYIKTVPQDPLGTTASCRPNYCYAVTSLGNSYHVGSQLEYQNPVLNGDKDCSSLAADSAQSYYCAPGSTYTNSSPDSVPFNGSTNLAGNNPDYIYDLIP